MYKYPPITGVCVTCAGCNLLEDINFKGKQQYFITVYRAKRPGEKQWIAYTLDLEIAKRFAKERNVNIITKYEVKKRDVLALFLRRGEKEIIVLDETKPKFIEEIEV